MNTFERYYPTPFIYLFIYFAVPKTVLHSVLSTLTCKRVKCITCKNCTTVRDYLLVLVSAKNTGKSPNTKEPAPEPFRNHLMWLTFVPWFTQYANIKREPVVFTISPELSQRLSRAHEWITKRKREKKRGRGDTENIKGKIRTFSW